MLYPFDSSCSSLTTSVYTSPYSRPWAYTASSITQTTSCPTKSLTIFLIGDITLSLIHGFLSPPIEPSDRGSKFSAKMQGAQRSNIGTGGNRKQLSQTSYRNMIQRYEARKCRFPISETFLTIFSVICAPATLVPRERRIPSMRRHLPL